MRVAPMVKVLGIAFVASLASCGGGSDDDDAVNYGMCGNSPNYMQSRTANTRWKKFPVTVAIDLSAAPGASTQEINAIYQRGIRAGGSRWAGSGQGALGEVTYVSGANADIVVRFGTTTGPTVAGDATVKYKNNGYIESATITLSNRIFSTYLQAPQTLEEEVREVMQHEMGHALFMIGHSPFGTDVMSESGGTNGGQIANPGPTQRDINTIREVYCRAP